VNIRSFASQQRAPLLGCKMNRILIGGGTLFYEMNVNGFSCSDQYLAFFSHTVL
jgi:hypothetical protein